MGRYQAIERGRLANEAARQNVLLNKRKLAEYDRTLKTTDLALESQEVLSLAPEQRAGRMAELASTSNAGDFWKAAAGKPMGQIEERLGANIRRAEMLGAIQVPKKVSRKTLQDAQGRQRFVDTGERVFPGVEAEAPQTSAIKDYNFYAQQERKAGRKPLSFNDWNMQSRKASAASTTVNVAGSEVGPIPAGHELITDPATGSRKMRPIPGSPAEKEALDAAKAQAGKERTAKIYNQVVLEDIGRAMTVVEEDPFWTTGFVGGQVLSNLGGTQARNLMGLLDSIKASIGFNRLQAIRDASPTGGALGPVSDTENKLLQAAYGSVLQSQSGDQLMHNLNRMREIYMDIVHGPGSRPESFAVLRGFSTPVEIAPTGRTATNPNTGEQVQLMSDGTWQPVQQ